MKFSDFVNITEKFTTFDPDDMISVCKRENNSKRDFLFVNRYQGKHVPAKPSEIINLYEDLRSVIQKHIDFDRKEKLCVIGFAETATAIGNYIADNLPNEYIYYLQTTREKSTEPLIVEFQEEHSHATEQALYGDLQKLKSCDRIMFVDDEISTGKTILNFVNELEKIKHFNYTVASFLNLQNKENKELFEQKNIQTRALIFGQIKDMNAKIDILKEKDINTEDISIANALIGLLEKKDQFLYDTLFIGTEENMYHALMDAVKYEKIEMKYGRGTYFQASTRSPICPATENNYILKNRIKFISAKDNDRKVFLYNIDMYKYIFLYADIENAQFEEKVSKILRPLCNYLYICSYQAAKEVRENEQVSTNNL